MTTVTRAKMADNKACLLARNRSTETRRAGDIERKEKQKIMTTHKVVTSSRLARATTTTGMPDVKAGERGAEDGQKLRPTFEAIHRSGQSRRDPSGDWSDGHRGLPYVPGPPPPHLDRRQMKRALRSKATTTDH